MKLITKWKALAQKTSNGITYVTLSIFFILILTPYAILIRRIVKPIPYKSQWITFKPTSYLNQY